MCCAVALRSVAFVAVVAAAAAATAAAAAAATAAADAADPYVVFGCLCFRVVSFFFVLFAVCCGLC